MGVPNSFGAITKGSGAFSRRWASTHGGNAVDPYITGYFFINFSYLPNLLSYVNQSNSGASPYSTLSDIKNAMHSSCTSVTLPGGTVNKTDFNGLGNIKFSSVTNVEYDNTATLRFTEWSGAPIYKIIHGWVKMIRDYRSGVSPLQTGGVTKADWAASMYYWTTKPDGKSVDTAFALTGMFPLRDPIDMFGHDLTAIDKLELDIDFNVDVLWEESWVYNKCEELASQYAQNYGNINSITSATNAYGQEDS